MRQVAFTFPYHRPIQGFANLFKLDKMSLGLFQSQLYIPLSQGGTWAGESCGVALEPQWPEPHRFHYHASATCLYRQFLSYHINHGDIPWYIRMWSINKWVSQKNEIPPCVCFLRENGVLDILTHGNGGSNFPHLLLPLFFSILLRLTLLVTHVKQEVKKRTWALPYFKSSKSDA